MTFLTPLRRTSRRTVQLLITGAVLACVAVGVALYQANSKRCQTRDAQKIIAGCTVIIHMTFFDREKLARMHFRRGTAYDNQERYDEAIVDFNEAIRLKPDYELAYSRRAGSYWGKGDHQDHVIADYDHVLRMSPDDIHALVMRGVAYSEKGQEDRALEDYERALSLESRIGAIYYNRAISYVRKGQLDRALQDFDTALRLAPDEPWCLFYRGVVRRRNGDIEGGDADIAAAKAIKADIADEFAKRKVWP